MTTPTPQAELVLRGGVIRTLDPSNSVASAVAVRGERIVAVGGEEEIAGWIGPQTRILELNGACALPGINDSHLHGAWLGALWPATLFDGPLPDLSPDDGATVAPDGSPSGADDAAGEADGEASGTAGDDAGAPADHHGEQPRLVHNDEELRAAILRAQRIAASLGITSYTEPGLGPGEDRGPTGVFGTRTLELYAELAAAGKLTSRVTALALFGLLDGNSALETFESELRGLTAGTLGGASNAGIAAASADPAAQWRVSGVKVFADGIPPARNAWIHGCYPEGGSGGLLIDANSTQEAAAALRSMVTAAHQAGLQVAVHATGDRTIDELARTLESLGDPEAVRAARHYIIHGDLASSEAITRLGALGIGYNTQPVISVTTKDWLAAAVGQDAGARAWPLLEVLDAGIRLALTSDAPVVAPDWRATLAAADAWMGPAEGANATEARMLMLLHAVTTAGAWQDHAEDAKGTLEVGKLADIAILAADPFSVAPAELPGIAVTHTLLGGRMVHSPEAPAIP